MFHLLILAIIETLYIDIQIFVYLNDGKTIIFGKASFYHSFHCKIVDSMPKTIVPGMMVPLDNGYYLVSVSAMLPLFFKQEYLALSSKKDESRNSFPPYSRSLQGTFA